MYLFFWELLFDGVVIVCYGGCNGFSFDKVYVWVLLFVVYLFEVVFVKWFWGEIVNV